MFHQLLPDAMVQAGGWAILHSLWQGTIITLLLAFLLGKTRQHTPALRYHLSVGALFLLLGTVVLTFLLYYEPGQRGNDIFSETGAIFDTYYTLENPAAELPQMDYLQRIFPFLLQVWMVGVALMGVRMLGELAYLQRLRSANTRAIAGHWLERLNALKWQMGILQPVALRESLRVSSPMLVGWIKPVILLPVGMLSGLSPQQVECVLAHELAHVQRVDYLINIIQSAVEVLLFFNPAVWWISAQIREEREHCCDELAIELTGDRLTLVKTLAQLEEWRMQSGHLGLAFNGRPQGVLGRVQRLLGGESSVRIIGKGLWSLLFFSLATGLLAFQGQIEKITPDHQWENVALMDEASDYAAASDLQAELAAIDKQSAASELDAEALLAKRLDKNGDVDPYVESLSMTTYTSKQLQKLVSGILKPLHSLTDTVPDEKWEVQMRALHQQMNALHEQMMNSQEMKQVQELTKKYETEMRAVQEKMQREQGGYEKMVEEQRKVMEKVEQKHRALMESEEFKTAQKEREKIAQEFARQADLLRKQYQGKSYLLENKLDSLSDVYDSKHEAFEKKYEVTMQALDKEMEALENSPEMKELQVKMEAIQEEMEKVMEKQMQPMEEQMNKLQEALEQKFEQQMRALEEKMEKLEQQRFKKEE